MSEKGFVYIMTNQAMPGLLKIGRTSKLPEKRAQDSDLASTGIPSKFEVQYYVLFDNMVLAEKKIHMNLNSYHYKKEFFRVDIPTAIMVIESINLPFKKIFSKPEDDEKAKELFIEEEIQKKKEERKTNETKPIIKESNKTFAYVEKDQKEVLEKEGKRGGSNTNILCLTYILAGCMITGYLSGDLNLFSRGLIIPFCIFFVVTGFLYKYKNNK